MRYHGLDLNLLIALESLLATRSITQSSQHLHLSQPAMSGALARLREHFRDDLLVSSGRRMILTPLAQAMVPQLHAVIMQVDLLLATDRRVIASDNTASVVLLDLQHRLQAQAPDVVLEIVPLSGDTLDRLRRGEVDLAILPEEYALEECVCARLYRDVFSCLVWNGSRRFGDSVSLDGYRAADHVTLQTGEGVPAAFYQRLESMHQIEITRKFLVPSFGLMALGAIGTDRVATVPARMARAFAQVMPVREVSPAFAMPALEEVMQWHLSMRNDAGLAWLRQEISELASIKSPAAETANPPAPG